MDPVEVDRGSAMSQFSIMLENRPGSLADLVRLLKEADIEVLGISVGDSVDVTVVRLVLSAPDSAEPLFVERGIPYLRSDLVLVEIDGVSAFADCLQTLRAAETNLHFSYALMSQPRGRPVLALAVEDVDFAAAVLNRQGFRTLLEEDIVR